MVSTSRFEDFGKLCDAHIADKLACVFANVCLMSTTATTMISLGLEWLYRKRNKLCLTVDLVNSQSYVTYQNDPLADVLDAVYFSERVNLFRVQALRGKYSRVVLELL